MDRASDRIAGAAARIAAAPDQAARIAALLAALRDLRARVAAGGDARLAGWAPLIRRAEFRASAANLADWLAFRAEDLTPLQAPLAQLGLSSLGRMDGHVRPALDAVIATLSALAGQAQPVWPPVAQFTGPPALLAARRDALFGARESGPGTRIMVTLPSEAAANGALVRRLVAEGADCVRINCAHDTPADWVAMIAHVRAAAAAEGRVVPVSMDLGGPKFRLRRVRDKAGTRLTPGDRFALAVSDDALPHGLPAATLSHAALVEALRPGSQVSLDDGKLRAEVVDLSPGAARLQVTRAPARGFRLKPEKGVNLPGAELRVAALTEDDLAALDTVAQHADIVAYSFVQTVADVRRLQDELDRRCGPGRGPAILLKIETPLALRALPDLIVAAGAERPVAVMIARGDLAVEIGFDRLSEIQEELLWLCAAAQVPVVWATQVLEGMVKEGQASRAEVTDAAMAQRAECVMLNKGPFLPEAVVFLRGILTRMDRHQSKKSARLAPLRQWI